MDKKTIMQTFPLEGKMYHSILGAIIGDIVGSVREAYKKHCYRTNFKLFTNAATISDDSVLTIAIADWLNHRTNNKETLSVRDALLKWGKRFPNVLYGHHFKEIIKTETFTEPHSVEDGAAMRVSPVALRAKSIDEVLTLAEISAKPTHVDAGVDGAKAIALAVYLAKEGVANGKSTKEIKAEIKKEIEKRFEYNLDQTVEEIRARSQNYGAMNKQKTRKYYTDMCEAQEACPTALVALLNANTYEDTIRIAVSMGGDCDTTAAMAGGIAAQLFGIPEAFVQYSLRYLPEEMIEVINKFDGTDFQPTGIAPKMAFRWTDNEYIVYGKAPEGEKSENGIMETIPSMHNRPMKAYPIPTIGHTLNEIEKSVNAFIKEAKEHQDRRYIVRKVGYDKAGFTLEQIAPLFRNAVGMRNILLPEEMMQELSTSKH